MQQLRNRSQCIQMVLELAAWRWKYSSNSTGCHQARGTEPRSLTRALLVSQSEPGPFNPGESYWHTNTFQLPVVSSTNGYLIPRADGNGQIYELNIGQ